MPENADAFCAPSSKSPATWESVAQLFAEPDFSTRALPALFREARWFGGKAHPLRKVRAIELLPVGNSTAGRLAIVEAIYENRPSESYVLPLQLAQNAPQKAMIFARFDCGVLFDAQEDARFRDALFEMILREKNVGETAGIRGAALSAIARELALPLDSRAVAAEQSNSAIIYGGRFFLKIYRKPEVGENPDAELTRFLTERQHFAHVPAFCGAIEHRSPTNLPRTLALLVANIPNEGDAWTLALRELADYFEKARNQIPTELSIENLAGNFPARARRLGQRTAEMHLALSNDVNDPRFAPEPFTANDLRALCEKARESARRAFQLIEQSLARLPELHRAEAAALVSRESEIVARLSPTVDREMIATKSRHHGDYHLGQVLNTGSDFAIIDFEGEPARSLAERRMKRSPLRDVAGMLRSFHYAANSAMEIFPGASAAAEMWTTHISRAFLDAYLATVKGAPFIPADTASLKILLDAHLLEKAIYEIDYELNHRPAWLFIPVRGVARILADEKGTR